MLVTIVILTIIVVATATYISLSVSKGQDAEREADINALASLAEDHYNTTGRYPLMSELTSGSVRGVNDSLLTPPGASKNVVATTTPTKAQYGYVTYDPTGVACTSGATCGKRFTLFWRSEQNGTLYAKKSVN